MSSNSIAVNTGQQMTIKTDLSKIFIWNNRTAVANFTAVADVTLLAGTLLGKVGATGKVVPLDSAATDGSQYPVGILSDDYTVLSGATVQLTYCVAGDVAQEKVILAAGDTMASLVEDRSIYDRIGSDTVGIKLVASTSNSEYDNV